MYIHILQILIYQNKKWEKSNYMLIIPGQGVGEKDEEDVTTALTIDVPKVAFLIIYIYS